MNDSNGVLGFMKGLLADYPNLSACEGQITEAFEILRGAFAQGGKLLLCGNGGSAADCDHIAGELMKGFLLKRPLADPLKERINHYAKGCRGIADNLADELQRALPCVCLTGHAALSTAFANDVNPNFAFAQQVTALGREGDALIGISTSGNAANVCCAVIAAKAAGVKTIGLTGKSGGRLAGICDAVVKVPDERTYKIQEYHLPIYHALCAMLEAEFFG